MADDKKKDLNAGHLHKSLSGIFSQYEIEQCVNNASMHLHVHVSDYVCVHV